jgi:hypothetical protein
MSIALTTKKSAEEVEQIELFSIDGVSYTIPNKARVNVGLRYMKIMRDESAEAAQAWLLEEMVGKEGFEALISYDDLTPEILEQIVSAAAKVVLGELETPKA